MQLRAACAHAQQVEVMFGMCEQVLVDGWGCTVGQTEQMQWLGRLGFIPFQASARRTAS